MLVPANIVGFTAISTLIGNTQPVPATQAVQKVNIPTKEVIDASTIYLLVNEERVKAGIPPLSRNPKLDASAQAKCDDMVNSNYYGHANPTTSKQGYSYAEAAISNGQYVSENINTGDLFTNKGYIDSWLGSPSHKAAMLDPKYEDTGVAVCKTKIGKIDIVQHFVQYNKQIPQAQQSAPSSVRLKAECMYTGWGSRPTGITCL